MVRGCPGVSRMTEPLIWSVRQLDEMGQRHIKQPQLEANRGESECEETGE